jgi:hypothetical protein
MAHPSYLREKARQLRRDNRLTVDELAERLAMSRSTIYYWVRDIPIDRKPARKWPEAARQRGNRAMRRRYRMLREAAYDERVRLFPVLEGHHGFRDFVCLYIVEGYKRNRNQVSICHSDPAVMKLALSWMPRLSANPLRYSLQYHADQDLAQLRAFWAAELGIEGLAIKTQRKSNSNQLRGRAWRSEHGVLTISASDTYFRAELQAWMDWVANEWLDSPGCGV